MEFAERYRTFEKVKSMNIVSKALIRRLISTRLVKYPISGLLDSCIVQEFK